MMQLRFRILADHLAIARLPADAPIPPSAATARGFVSITRTDDELSVTCAEALLDATGPIERGWRAIKLEGPFAFDQVGILAAVLVPLAKETIGIFAISTYDTDYILVKQHLLDAAIAALQAAGHRHLA